MTTRLEVLKMGAQVFKAMGHPLRLCLLDQLITDGPCNVTKFINCMDASQPNISQHLRVLRESGIVNTRRKGNQVIYSCDREDIGELIKLMHENLHLDDYPLKNPNPKPLAENN